MSATHATQGVDRGPGSIRHPICEIPVMATDLDLVAVNAALLSEDEVDRAYRYHRPRHRRRFMAARIWLRTALAGKLGCSTAEIRFRYGALGKPEIAGPDTGIHFNLAHSGSVAVLAIDETGPVGIDIERLPGAFDPAAAALVLSAAEMAFVTTAVDPNRAFLECWTRKEAFAKLDGRGLDRDLVALTLSGPLASPAELGVAISDLDVDGAVGALAWPMGYPDPVNPVVPPVTP